MHSIYFQEGEGSDDDLEKKVEEAHQDLVDKRRDHLLNTSRSVSLSCLNSMPII